MSPRLIQPGLLAAGQVTYPRWHSRAGEVVQPIGILPSGKVVWPAIGGSDDPNDPTFTGEGEDDDSDDEDDDDDDESSTKGKKTTSKRRKSSEDDDEDEDEDDEDSSAAKASRQAKRYRLRLRAEETRNREMAARLKVLEDRDKPDDEVVSRDLSETRDQLDKVKEVNRLMTAQLAFFKTTTGIEWADPNDAFALAEREGLFDDVVDEDGTVDQRELRRGLKDLAKRKPHLVKKPVDDPKARGRKSTDTDDEEEDDEEPRSRQSGSTMNGNRRGKKGTPPSRAELAKKFPVLGKV